MTVIVAHAPPNDSGEQGRASFWSHLRNTAQAVPRARPLALLMEMGEVDKEQIHRELPR